VVAELAPVLPPSTPVAVAGYLRELRPTVAQLAESRQVFIRRIGTLMERVRQGDLEGVSAEADQVGREAASQYRYARVRVESVGAPGVCEACHEAVLGWIDMLITAADVLAEFGTTEDRGRLREVQTLLAESRIFSNRFKAQYEALVARLRERGTAPAAPKQRRVARLLRFGRRG
jgi:hypothetical protein